MEEIGQLPIFIVGVVLFDARKEVAGRYSLISNMYGNTSHKLNLGYPLPLTIQNSVLLREGAAGTNSWLVTSEFTIEL